MKYIFELNTYQQQILNNELLEYSSNKSALQKIRELISKGADVNIKKNGKTPLINATIKMFYNGVKLLIEKGADVNITNDNNESPLLILFMFPNYTFKTHINIRKIIDLLINNGADMSIKNLKGKDIFDFKPDMETDISFYFPEQYEEYLMKKNIYKFNL